MGDLFEGFVITFIFIVVLSCCYMVGTEYVKELAKQDMQAATYAECLTTDYDKFQCYSMIYGDK